MWIPEMASQAAKLSGGVSLPSALSSCPSMFSLAYTTNDLVWFC